MGVVFLDGVVFPGGVVILLVGLFVVICLVGDVFFLLGFIVDGLAGVLGIVVELVVVGESVELRLGKVTI